MNAYQEGEDRRVEQDSPYGMEIKALDAKGNPIKGLPTSGGFFERTLPTALFERNPKSLALGWIDFFDRNEKEPRT